MELGIGTGPNLMYYGGRPSVSKVIGVDPNEKMAPYAQAAASAIGLQPSQFQFLHAVFPLTFPLICYTVHSIYSNVHYLQRFALDCQRPRNVISANYQHQRYFSI